MAITSTIRLRMSAKDAHYGGNLVDGAHMVQFVFPIVSVHLLYIYLPYIYLHFQIP